LGSPTALGSTANNVSVSSGSTLDLGGQTVGTNPLALVGNGVGGNGSLINSSQNPASYAGNVTLTGPATVGPGQITLSGSVSGNSLTMLGNLPTVYSLTLSGATDNINLGMVVNNGIVILAKSSSSSPAVHAIGQPGLLINGGVVQLGGTGGDQIYDFASVTVT